MISTLKVPAVRFPPRDVAPVSACRRPASVACPLQHVCIQKVDICPAEKKL